MVEINLPLATTTWDEDEIEAIESVTRGGQFSMSKHVVNFEEQFANYFGSKFAVMVNSGSSANLLMIAAMIYSKNPKINLSPGDEVIVPAVSWSTTYYPLMQFGLKLKFIDIDVETLNFSIEKLKDAITSKTRAVFCVNLLGNPCEFSELLEICEEREIHLLEDNCESMGAKYNNKHSGTFGLMGSFSTYFSHHISTMEGGVVLTDNEELYEVMRSVRSHGWTRHLSKNNALNIVKNKDPFYEQFNFILPGFNLRPLEYSGAIGLSQLKKLDNIVTGRRKNAHFFVSQNSNHKNIIIQREISESSWFGFSIVLRKGKALRDELVDDLVKMNVDVRPIVAGNFTRHQVISYFDYEISGNLTNADFIHDAGLFIGNHHYDITEPLSKISEQLARYDQK